MFSPALKAVRKGDTAKDARSDRRVIIDEEVVSRLLWLRFARAQRMVRDTCHATSDWPRRLLRLALFQNRTAKCVPNGTTHWLNARALWRYAPPRWANEYPRHGGCECSRQNSRNDRRSLYRRARALPHR